MKRSLPRMASIFGIWCVLVSAAAFADEPTVIRVAAVAMQVGGHPSFFGPAEYAERDPQLKTDLEKHHASIEWVPISAVAVATLVNEAFTAHRIDFAYYGDLPSVILNASGFQTRLVAPGNVGNNVYIVVPPNSNATSIADLKGQRIALNRGRPWEISFGKLLAADGLRVSEFKIINVNPQAGAAALVGGSVDAFVTLSDAYLLADKGLGKIIWSTKNAPADWKMRAELWGTQSFVQQHPDLTQILVNANLRAVSWISDERNRAAYVKDMAEHYGYPESVIQRETDNEDITWKQYWSPLYSASITRHYEGVVAYARAAGLIRNDVDVKSLLEPTFVADGLKTLDISDLWTASLQH